MNFAKTFTILTDLTSEVILWAPGIRTKVHNRFDFVFLVLKLYFVHELVAHDPVSQVVHVIVVVRELDRLPVLEDNLAEAFGEDVRGE